ncbi:Uncharacterised protein [Segatella copri]|nr:Uncharacterised protein [Segatella copri]
MEQTIECGYWANIGEEAQLLTHSEQALLRTNLGCRVVVETWVTNGCEEYSISIHTSFEGLLWEWITYLVDSVSAADSLVVSKLVVELLCNGLHNCYALLHNLWSDTITGENCNV